MGNPSSAHVYGRRAHDLIERARSEVARLIGAREDEIVFTSGGTESNNLAIRGTALGAGAIVTSRSSILLSARNTSDAPGTSESSAWSAPTKTACWISPLSVARISGSALVSIMHANNETGVIQPVAEVARTARASGVLVHTDAAQSVGKVQVDVQELGVDLLTIAGHKLYAPKGVGALFVRRGHAIEPLALGAPHERGRRSGTENVVGIAGLGDAAALARRNLDAESARVAALRDGLIEHLRGSIANLVVHGARALPTEHGERPLPVRVGPRAARLRLRRRGVHGRCLSRRRRHRVRCHHGDGRVIGRSARNRQALVGLRNDHRRRRSRGATLVGAWRRVTRA